MALGLCLSAFAQTEFQAVQFMPAFVLPQLLLCGLLVPTDQMAPLLVLDLVPAADDLRVRRARAGDGGRARMRDSSLDVLVVAGAIVLALVLGAATLRRRTP